MAEFSHMGGAADATIRFVFMAIAVMAVSIPLAVWKLIDIAIWLMEWSNK